MSAQEAAKALLDSEYPVAGESIRLEAYLKYRLGQIAETCKDEAFALGEKIEQLDAEKKEQHPLAIALENVFPEEDYTISHLTRTMLTIDQKILDVHNGRADESVVLNAINNTKDGLAKMGRQADILLSAVPQRMAELKSLASGAACDMKPWRDMISYLQTLSDHVAAADKKETEITRDDIVLEALSNRLLQDALPGLGLPGRRLKPVVTNAPRLTSNTLVANDIKARAIAADILNSKVVLDEEEKPAANLIDGALMKAVIADNPLIMKVVRWLDGEAPKPSYVGSDPLFTRWAKEKGVLVDELPTLGINDTKPLFHQLIFSVARRMNKPLTATDAVLQSIVDTAPDKEISSELRAKIMEICTSLKKVDFSEGNHSAKVIREKLQDLNAALNPTLLQPTARVTKP